MNDRTTIKELDLFTLTDDPARDYPLSAWVLTPTTNPKIHPDYRHCLYEVWAPDPEHLGEGICVARLSDGIKPWYGLLLAARLQEMWPEPSALVTMLGGAVCDVVIGNNNDDLHERGKAFVEEQGCNAGYELCDVEVLPDGLHHRPHLRRTADGHRDFQVLVGDTVLMLVEVFPQEAHPANYRRTPRNRAVEFVINGPGHATPLFYRQTGLEEAADYLGGLGINPAPLWELARNRGWEVA